MPHGLSHHLGLDVHDVSSTGAVAKTLECGHVVTCEPGLYFIEPLIRKALEEASKAPLLNLEKIEAMSGMGGVRIEDNVLIQVSCEMVCD
jgi:Xaa-Pro dipeptidase